MADNKKDAGRATNEARKADLAKPDAEKDAVATMANVHRDNVNPNAYSPESARKLGSVDTPSINEPKPGEQVAFKVPEDHTVTTPETLAQDYPDGYVPPEPPPEEVIRYGFTGDAISTTRDPGNTSDPDDLEDEIDQARRDGDFKPMHRSFKSPPKKRK